MEVRVIHCEFHCIEVTHASVQYNTKHDNSVM